MSTINERIKKIIDVLYKGNATAFARIVNFGPSTIHSIIGKKQSIPTFTVISSIYEALSKEGLSAHWLLTGEGDMTDEPKEAPNPFMLNELSDMVSLLEDRIREKDDIISQRDRLISNILSKCVK